MPEPPDGPYYRCGVMEMCGLIGPRGHKRPSTHPPDKLRYIKGIWQCFDCFYANYADGTPSAQHAWDDAPTVSDL